MMAKAATWRKTPFAHAFYHSRSWQDVRAFVLDRSHGLCERCLEKGEIVPADVVHHVVPLSETNMNDPSISLNPDKLMALCDECHAEVHGMLGIGALNGMAKPAPRVSFDKDGNVIRREEQ